MSSTYLDIMESFQADTTLGNLMGEKLTDLDVSIKSETDSEGLDNGKLLPYGKLQIEELSVTVGDKTSLREVTGEAIISQYTISFELIGWKDSTDFEVRAAITNYWAATQPDTTTELSLIFGMQGDRLRVVDFFKFKVKVSFPLPIIRRP